MALTGINKDMLHYLSKEDIVVPTSRRKQGERGYGVRSKYTFTDLVSFKVVKKPYGSVVSSLHDLSFISDELVADTERLTA